MSKNHYINEWDTLTERIFGFFVGQGFLIVPSVKALASVKIDIAEAIRVGTDLEPRVLDVLPAALLRFPRSFRGWDKVPDKLQTVLE